MDTQINSRSAQFPCTGELKAILSTHYGHADYYIVMNVALICDYLNTALQTKCNLPTSICHMPTASMHSFFVAIV